MKKTNDQWLPDGLAPSGYKAHCPANDRWLPENFPRFDLCFSADKFILINIPKNASAGMKHALKTKHRVSFFECSTSARLVPGAVFKKTCVVIRDPKTRIISSFSELLKLRNDCNGAETRNSKWFKIYKQNPKKNLKKAFKLFLNHIEKRLYDPHLHTQTSYLNGKNLSLEDVDYTLVLENLNEDFKKMSEETGIPDKIRRWQHASPTHLPWWRYIPEQKSILSGLINYDEAIKNQIKSIYAKDFILYDKAKLLKI